MNNIEKIKQLRSSTGAGFKDCSSALQEASDDIEKAIEILRVKGIAKASKKMSREAKEGVVAISGDSQKSSIIEINCETDFVAKNHNFIDFAKELSELNNKCDSNTKNLKNSIMKNNKSVDENLISMITKIGEKITIGRSKTINHPGTKNFTYHHTLVKDNLSKLAVIVSLQTNEKSKNIDLFGRQLSMHIAASNPIALDSENIKKEIIEKEQKLIAEELKLLITVDQKILIIYTL